MFIPAKENAELTLACVSEGGNPKPMLSWEVLLSPGIDRHAQKLSTDLLELQEIKPEKDKVSKRDGSLSELSRATNKPIRSTSDPPGSQRHYDTTPKRAC